MTAEVRGRIEDGDIELQATGEAHEHITLLATYAEDIAEATGHRPYDVLQRVQSRIASMHRSDRDRAFIAEVSE